MFNTTTKNGFASRFAISTVLLSSLSVPAFAQVFEDEIIVTATRSGQTSLQDTPIAVSAISTDDISQKGVDGIVDILKSVPSINVISQGPGQTQFTIRGIASGQFAPTETGDRPLVAVYFDDVPISVQGYNPDLKVFDLEQIEILRGPQGTLYGAGSMAGTVRYITKKPSIDGFSGSAEGVLSSTSRAGDPNWNLKGSINAPLSESLAFLGGVYFGEDAGYIDNIGLGQEDVNSAQTTQARGALRFTGIDNVTLDASLTFSDIITEGTNAAYDTLPEYTYDSLSPDFFDDELLIANVSAEIALGSTTLISSTSYLDRDVLFQSSGNYETLIAGVFGGLRFDTPGSINNDIETFTQEFRLYSDTEQRFSWLVGAFYENTDRQYDQENFALGQNAGDPGVDDVGGLPSVPSFGTPSPNTIFLGMQDISESQIAIFADINYKFTDSLNLTVGGRYFDFQQDFSLAFTGLAGSGFAPTASGTPIFAPLVQTGSPKENGFNPRAVLSYEPNEDTLFFGEVSTGFRYGSVNEPVASDFCAGITGPVTVGSDELTNYAIGLKKQSADRKVTFNATAFFIDWENVQSRFDLDCGYYYRVNEGNVHSKGIEIESLFRLADNWTVSVNGSYTDATAQKDVFAPSSVGPAPTPVALEGQKAPLFPDLIAAISTEYDIPLNNGNDLSLRGDLQHRSGYGNIFDTGNAAYRKTPDQTLINASVNYTTDSWELGLFATNLTNNDNISSISPTAGADYPGKPVSNVFYGRPRTVGVRAKAKFN